MLKNFVCFCLVSLIVLLLGCSLVNAKSNSKVFYLDELNVTKATCGVQDPQSRKSVDKNPITIAGKVYERGFGTNAPADFRVKLFGKASRFLADVGFDDEVLGRGDNDMEFKVYGDGELLWSSGIMQPGKVEKADVDVTGVERLKLIVDGHGGDMFSDHADWADARIVYSGRKPALDWPKPRKPYILTPKPGVNPRVNGPKVFGVRPNSPFIYRIPATGERPMTFKVEGLPEGLTLDSETGMITGTLTEKTTHKVTLIAENARGRDSKEFRIVCGDKICLTPPLGWNGWNSFGEDVIAKNISDSADIFIESGLANHGWMYINIDDGWQGDRGGEHFAIMGNDKFGDMKSLCDYIHSLGLKVGIYSSPWVGTYAGFRGGSGDTPDQSQWRKPLRKERHNYHHVGQYSFAQNDARQFGDWGIDYLKYDWHPNDIKATSEMSEALRNSKRDIAYSLSNNAPFENAAEYAKLANCWRTTDDIVDRWSSIVSIGFERHDKWANYCGPGHYNDADMLVLGWVGIGRPMHPTRLTPDEQYTHMSLWALLTSPLLIGCDLTKLDDFTLNLLTNDEVLAINQDSLCKQAERAVTNGDHVVYVKQLDDGSKAVGLFNLGTDEEKVTVNWSDLGIEGTHKVRDVWRQKDIGEFDDSFSADVYGHGVVLVRIF